MYLWRGMKNMSMNMSDFRKHGGTELAPMSTTATQHIALRYTSVDRPLLPHE
jgi:hypothetical protein